MISNSLQTEVSVLLKGFWMKPIIKSVFRYYVPNDPDLTALHVQSVVDNLRLVGGALFPIPVTLDVSRGDIERLSIATGSRLTLLDPRDEEALAIITGITYFIKSPWNHSVCLVEDIYTPDKVKEAIQVFGADDPAHPSVAYLRNRVKDFYIGGKVQAIKAPTHFDYVALRCEIIYW